MSCIRSYTIDKGVFQEFFMLLGKLVHSDLVRQIEYLRVENQILRSKLTRRINVTAAEKRRLIKFGLALGPNLRRFMSIVSYTTFRRWLKDRNPHVKTFKRGRRRKSQDIRDLVVRFAKENNWGYTRILGELKKLGIFSISRNTVKNILRENGFDPAPQRGEDSWDSFVKRHCETLWACDFFSKTVLTMLGPKIFHVLFFINVNTRKVHIAGMSTNPTTEWVDKTTRSVSFLFQDSSRKLLIRDGDCKFLGRFDEILKNLGTEVKRIPYRSPNLNPYAESWIGTIKRECLDHFFMFGENHFKYLVEEFVRYYNTVRPHSGKNNAPLEVLPMTGSGHIQSNSKLGGLIRHYYRI
jgi:putative transposase